MARFVAVRWDHDESSSWSIILRDRSGESLVDRVDAWMREHPPTKVTSIGVARVPPGVNAERFVSTLPAPDVSDCPLCRAGTAHTIH